MDYKQVETRKHDFSMKFKRGCKGGIYGKKNKGNYYQRRSGTRKFEGDFACQDSKFLYYDHGIHQDKLLYSFLSGSSLIYGSSNSNLC